MSKNPYIEIAGNAIAKAIIRNLPAQKGLEILKDAEQELLNTPWPTTDPHKEFLSDMCMSLFEARKVIFEATRIWPELKRMALKEDHRA